MSIEDILSQSTNVDYQRDQNDGACIVWCKICKTSLTSSGMSGQSFESHAKAFVLKHDKCSPGVVPCEPFF
jgi:hypothetical protein